MPTNNGGTHGTPIRIQDNELIVHITNRTDQARFLFVPDDEFNEIVHYWLRRSILVYEPDFYAGLVMSNHPHLIARFPHMNMDAFMGYFQSNLSRETNILRKRYHATTFPKRYSAEPILDVESLLRLLDYLYNNPVAANLVARPEQWPGLTTFRQSAGFDEPRPLPLTLPPCWAHLSPAEIEACFRALVEPTIAAHAAARRWPVMGAERVRKQKWWKRPKLPKRGKSATLHGATKLIRWHGANFLDRVRTRYATASLAWRDGDDGVAFPYGTRPPGRTESSRDAPDHRPSRLLRSALLGGEDPER